jgi:cation-transporting P-type ATPase E
VFRIDGGSILAMTAPYPGLTTAEVAERIRDGLINRAPRSGWADYTRIARRNVFTLFNILVTPAAVALFIFRNYPAGIAVSGMAIVNTTLGLAQELRAKRQLEKLAILVETTVRVRRDGQDQQIAAGSVVLGDLILLTGGEPIVADGTVIASRFLEVDEALLTGESDPVRREPGQKLLSGSFCVAGEGSYRADRVGTEAFAQSTSAEAKSYRYTPSPLTKTINLLIQLLTYTAVGLCLIYVVLYLLGNTTQSDLIQNMAATITSMVPQGLVLTATISFSLGAIQMSRRGAIVQRLSAVESMASIDVICTDKTGTLTTNQLRLDQLCVLPDVNGSLAKRLLGIFAAASLDQGSKTVQALRTALHQPAQEAIEQLPFKAQNRYSAVRLRAGDSERVLVLGAPEALRPHLDAGSGNAWEQVCSPLLPTGLRLLLFCEATRPQPLGGTLDGVTLRPLLLVALSDELRPEAGQVLETLAAQGIDFKVISGDNPATVRATVSHLNLPLAHDPVVTGDELAASTNPAELIAQRGVFGRVAPAQKVQIVQTLQELGRHVAMIGDGVNDVLPIKRSDLGIAMGEGSQAAKTVSSLVLQNNNFALLPETLEEGRTIIRNVRRSAKLFLVKNVYSLLFLLAYASGLMPFPYLPQQVTLLNWLVIGIPAFAIALSRERSTGATKPRFLREVGWFAVRTGVIFAAAGFTVLFVAGQFVEPADAQTPRTLLLSVLILLGITALFRALGDGEEQRLKGDSRFRLLALAAMPVYLASMYVPLSAEFFQLAPLTSGEWLLVLAVVVPAFGLTLLSDRCSLPSSYRPASPTRPAE